MARNEPNIGSNLEKPNFEPLPNTQICLAKPNPKPKKKSPTLNQQTIFGLDPTLPILVEVCLPFDLAFLGRIVDNCGQWIFSIPT